MYAKLLVPLDGSKLAECVLPHVESFIKGCGVQTIVFFRAVPDRIGLGGKDFSFGVEEWKRIETGGVNEASTYLDRLAGSLGWDGRIVQREVARGGAPEAIADYAEKNGVDLIIMATHGTSGISRWAWGSVADRVLRSAKIPVLMVRPEGCGGT